MRVVDGAAVAGALAFPDLIEALAEAFAGDLVVPLRHHHAITRPGGEAALILMPAWTEMAESHAGFVGVKIVTVFPENADRGLPSVTGTYLLLDGASGTPLAAIDGRVLTLLRTAAASALAARYLARPDASRMAMIGAGALVPQLIAAHASVRPIREVRIWNRTAETAAALAARLTRPGLAVSAAATIAEALDGADIVSAATLSHAPLIEGRLIAPGTHIDLVGGFTPDRREADDATILKARLYVDTRAGALHEAGDIVQPLKAGLIRESDIAGDLFDLCRGTAAGRREAAEVTLFKSVGTAIEDLAAAMLLWRRLAPA